MDNPETQATLHTKHKAKTTTTKKKTSQKNKNYKQHRSHQKTGNELMCSKRVRSYCF